MWDLQFDKQHKIMDYFDDCELKEKQESYFNVLVKHYSNEKYSSLQIGYQEKRIAQNWFILDPYDKRPHVDIRIKLEDVKRRTELHNKFDFIVAKAIFEHVENPFECAEAIYLLLKDDGQCYIDFPFAFPYHPFKGYNEADYGYMQDYSKLEFENDEYHGGDYWRYTPCSIKMLFKKFKTITLQKTVAGSFIYRGRK